ncbi:hypothetical protein [Mesorhizobium sp. CAU 1741]|uniref:hypothetical protein n=1 Tax=Mesorhizobium sp. CAU 1741 TaxID=3140366 RepID=UPI00325AA15D
MKRSGLPTEQEVAAELAVYGLILRGGVVLAEDGGAARTVLLVGNAGAAYWTTFLRWREQQISDPANPLDSWSRNVIDAVARRFGARVVMPSDRPFAPFQQWAMKAERLRPSPLGLLMHPRYGPWHAYRGALVFDRELPLLPVQAPHHPCDTCEAKPCLSACPVDAYSPLGFAYSRCVSHVAGDGGQPCRTIGCLARNACPVGSAYRYPSAVQAFHQKAFAAL